MIDRTALDTRRLIEILDEAVRLPDVEAVTARIQSELSEIFESGALRLPGPYYEPADDCYARRLLHRNERLGYTAVVMTWGPGQGTPLHDHAGIWCVEGVVQGEMSVTRYHLTARKDELYRFEEVERVRAGVGSSGSLIPPFEHHVLANALDDRPSLTLHVYGGEMDRCCIYAPRDDGWYERVEKSLAYH